MLLSIDIYPEDSPERAVALFLNGWHQRDWDSMLKVIHPSWKMALPQTPLQAHRNRGYTPYGTIRANFEGRVLDAAEIRGVQPADADTLEQCSAVGVDPALVADVQVLITWHPARIYPVHRLERALLLRCMKQGTDQSKPFGMSEDAPWGVNPNSVQRVVDVKPPEQPNESPTDTEQS